MLSSHPNPMRPLPLLLSVLFPLCVQAQAPSAQAPETAAGKSGEQVLATTANQADEQAHKRLYYVQHRLLRDLSFQSRGLFFADLESGKIERIQGVLTEILGERAKDIRFEYFKEGSLALITFPEPQQTVDCYFVAVVKVDGGYRYFTLEKTEDIMGLGIKACLCEWTSEGSHLNLGSTKSSDQAAFLQQVRELLKQETVSPVAVTTPKKEAPETPAAEEAQGASE